MGRAFGNERVGNIGTIIDIYPSAAAHGESVRSCTHICRFELFLQKTLDAVGREEGGEYFFGWGKRQVRDKDWLQQLFQRRQKRNYGGQKWRRNLGYPGDFFNYS